MTAGMLVYFQRRGLSQATWASLVTGFIGGFGFATATLFKLIEIKTGWNTNWHSVLEQTYGFINGAGVAVAMLFLARHAPRVDDQSGERRWTDLFAVGFVLLLVTWLNLRKNPERWVEAKAAPEAIVGLSSQIWFELAYLVLAAVVVWLLVSHTRRALPFIPPNWLGKGQLLYLVFLWWMVAGNFERALVAFAPQRLVTEGVIFFNATICTLLALLCVGERPAVDQKEPADFGALIRKTAIIGLMATAISVTADWRIVRAIYGDTFAGYAAKHIRFGPEATATTEKPKPSQPHP